MHRRKRVGVASFKAGSRNQSLMGGFLTYLSGTAGAQVVAVAAAPLLSRLYSPEAFGVFTLISAVASAVAVVACWRYDQAILLPCKQETAAALARLSLTIGLGTCCLFGFVGFLAAALNAPALSLGAAGVALTLAYAISTFVVNLVATWGIRINRLRDCRDLRFGSAVIVALLQIACGMLHPEWIGLCASYVVGSLAVVTMTAWRWGYGIRSLYSGRGMVSDLGAAAFEYRLFPMVNTWSALLDSIKYNGVIFVIGYFFGDATVGQYGQAWRFAAAPVVLASGTLAPLVYRQLAGVESDQLFSVASRVIGRMALLGVGIFVPMGFLLPEGFQLILGPNWAEAGDMAQSLTPWMAVMFFGGPVSGLFLVLQLQRSLVMFSALHALSALGSLYLAHLYGLAAVDSILMMSSSVAACYIGGLAWGLAAARNRCRAACQGPPLDASEVHVPRPRAKTLRRPKGGAGRDTEGLSRQQEPRE